jgi:hypothetical protein
MIKLYGTILALLIILSSCGSVCAFEPLHPNCNEVPTHIDIGGKSAYQHIYIEKGKNKNIKAELYTDGSLFGIDRPLTNEELIWFAYDNHNNLMSTNYRCTDMFGNSYQTFETGQLEKGDYVVSLYYRGGQYYNFRERYLSSSKSMIITVT